MKTTRDHIFLPGSLRRTFPWWFWVWFLAACIFSAVWVGTHFDL